MQIQTPKQRAVESARYLRRRQTGAEDIFWQKIRRRQFYNLKILRQHPIYYQVGNKMKFVIVDFYCHEKRLVIEVDGGIHKSQQAHDKQRSIILKELGLKVIRIQNEAVFKNVNGVLNKLGEMIL